MPRILARLALYPSLAWNVVICRLLRRWNWWDQVEPLLYLGARPFTSDVPRLHEMGVRAVINTCEEYAGPLAAYREFNMTQLHLPTVDFTSPSVKDLQAGVEFIEAHQAEGDAVYLHCKAGRGRSATLALCWLMYTRKLLPEEALGQLLAARPQVSKSLAQRPVVQQFHRNLSR